MRVLVSHEAVSVSPLISSSLFVSLIVFATSDLVLACPASCWFPLTRLRARGVFLQDRKSTGIEVVDNPAYHLWWECTRLIDSLSRCQKFPASRHRVVLRYCHRAITFIHKSAHLQ